MLKKLQQPLFQDLFNVGLLAVAIVPLLALSFYNHPSPVDDYCYIDTVFKYGYFEAMNFYYTGWTGRYFGILLNHSNPLVVKWAGGFKLLSFLLVLGLTGSLFALCKELFAKWNRWGILGITGGIMLLFLLKIMSIVEAFYWMAAFVTYTVPNILTLYWLTVMIRMYQQPNGMRQKLTAIFAGFLVFAVIGCSETNLTIMVLLVAGWFGYQLVIRRKWDNLAFFMVIIAVFSCYIFFTSPGNILRMNGNPEGRNFTLSTIQSLKKLTQLSIDWVFRTPLLVFSILWIAVLPRLFDKYTTAIPYFRVPIWIVILTYLGILFVQIFPSYYGIGIEPAPRVINSIYFYFLLGWFYTLSAVLYWLYRNQIFGAQHWYLPPSIKAVLALLILVSTLFSSNLRMVYGDWLRGRAATYDQELKARYAYIESTPGDTVYVAPLKSKPQSIYLDDANPNPKHLWSRCMGGYFGKKAVVLKATP